MPVCLLHLSSHLSKGLTDSGVNVHFLGLVTTPISYYSTFQSELSGAIMITGSHNPPDYNGFKISVGQRRIFGEEIQKIKNIMLQGDYTSVAAKNDAGLVKPYDIFTPYLNRFGDDFLLKKPVKVVVDCGNGAAGVVVRKLFSKIGIDCQILYEDPDGSFPNHHPDPTVLENLHTLIQRVKETNAVAGIGFDGDADRIGVVDHTGRPLFGDELMVIFARSVLEKHPGTAVIGDAKCSDRLYDDIAKHKGIPVMYKTGHSLIKNKMKEMSSKFSGEMSGHVFFADRNYGYDDAVYAGARLIEILSGKMGRPFRSFWKDFLLLFLLLEIRIDTTEAKKKEIVEAIAASTRTAPQAEWN